MCVVAGVVSSATSYMEQLPPELVRMEAPPSSLSVRSGVLSWLAGSDFGGPTLLWKSEPLLKEPLKCPSFPSFLNFVIGDTVELNDRHL